MDQFILENWEVVGERIKQDEFSSMQVDVFSEPTKTEGLISDSFDAAIKYAKGPRAHISKDQTRAEQAKKLQEEEEERNRVSMPQEELDKLLQDAYNRGREEALAEAIDENNNKLGRMEQSLSTVLRDIVEQEKSNLALLTEDALNLTLEISKRVIEHAVEINPEYILDIIKQSLQLSGGAKIKKIRVSPQDMEFIEVLKVAQTLKEYDGSWVFEADETIRAGCILESSAGIIDFELDKAWNRIRDKVLSLKKD